jgi:outer membrane protein OmpA-like peptidoglycan-associated protein
MLRRFSTLAFVALFAAACATSQDDPNQKAKKGAGAGAVAGAIVGAIIGNQSGNPATGAVIGAAAGAAIGGAVGHRMDQQQKELQQIPGVEVSRPAENEIAVHMTNDILFDVDSHSLRLESEQTLRDLASNFLRYPEESISVEGYTDATGTAAHNQILSENRAASVHDYLVDQGVPASRITARGYGETNARASNSTPEGRQLNRRVEIHIRTNG